MKRKYFPPAWDYISALDSVNILYEIMISLKKQCYEKEQEWRLIQALDEKPKQYINTYFYNDISGVLEFPILSIKLGPKLDKIKTKETIDVFLKNSADLFHPIKLKKEIMISSSDCSLKE